MLSRRVFVLVVPWIALACRGGDTAVCEQADPCPAGEFDAVSVWFESRGYDDCADGVDSFSCGETFERLRRCVNALEAPLCLPYRDYFEAGAVLDSSPCEGVLQAALSCSLDHPEHTGGFGDD